MEQAERQMDKERTEKDGREGEPWACKRTSIKSCEHDGERNRNGNQQLWDNETFTFVSPFKVNPPWLNLS